MTDTSTTKQIELRLGTSALREYLWASVCDSHLFLFICNLALGGDHVSLIAKQALDGAKDYKELTPGKLAKTKPGVLTLALRQSRQELLEMFLSRAVDNFQVYLVDIIRLALHKQPRILSERKQEITLSHILKFDSIEALTRDIVEAKLSVLSYEGFGELEDWCQSKAIPLVVPDGKRMKIVELIALRNIIIHSRGAIDDRYKTAVRSSSFEVGKKRVLDVDDLLGAVELLDTVAKATDGAIAVKFGIEQQDVTAELASRSAERWSSPPRGTAQKGGKSIRGASKARKS